MKKTLCMLALLALLLTACAPVPPPDPPENPTEAPTENPSETPPDSQNPSNLPDSQPEAPEEPWQVDEATLTDDYLISLVIDMEIGLVGDNEFTFHDPTELSNDELYLCFLLLTDYKELEEHLRKGVWQGRETDLFYFTEDYITSRLSRFFKTFHFDITKCFNYDPDANAIVTPLASGFGGGREMKVTEKVLEGNTVTFTTTFHKWAEPDSPPYMTKTYTIEFYDGGYYYLSAIEIE